MLKALTFDLDDTLWDNAGVMLTTEQGHVDWLTENLAEWQRARGEPVTPAIALELYQRERVALGKRTWERRGDFSWLRERTLITLLKASGLNTAAARLWAALAMDRFHSLRIQVTPFPSTDAMLERLRPQYRLGTITNGNVAFHRLPLRRYFDACIAAGEMFAPKPDPRPFLAMLARLGVSPGQALHVGDSWEEDVLPALRLGMRAVWIAPATTPVPEGPSTGRGSLPAGVVRLERVTELEALLADMPGSPRQ
ncbi:HAD family hydrolase [Halomonas sp. V046]|uniref:HAD family hydrolase n=1 Tax=Halomonas sp. V046 TaxID=3459611 RepID=UPI004043F940